MAARKRAAPKLYELHVELEDIKPPIWRRILVPGSIKLPALHDLLQLVMGWSDSHLHSFEIGKKTFTVAHDDMEELNMVTRRNIRSGAFWPSPFMSSFTSTTSETAGASYQGQASSPAQYGLVLSPVHCRKTCCTTR